MPYLSRAQLQASITRTLRTYGYAEQAASVLAANCVQAEIDGSRSTGLFRLKDYRVATASGYVNGSAVPRVHDTAPGRVDVDADNGFATVAVREASALARQKALDGGVAVLVVRNSHHLGALYLDIEPFAVDGLVAIAFVNSGPFVAAPGMTRAFYGTNPFALAAPRTGGPPLVIDQSSAVMSHGDLQLAATQGRTLGPDTGVDHEGRDSRDAAAILDGGAMRTFGGHKGASMALAMEILCAGLVGANFSYEVASERPAGATTARTGETVVLIDPDRGPGSGATFAHRVEQIALAAVAAGQARVPGDRRAQARASSGDHVEVSDSDWELLVPEEGPHGVSG